MSEQLGKEPAFPSEHLRDKSILTDGMSKRFYAACAAMQGLLANSSFDENIDEIISLSFTCADELLKQESEGTK